MGDEYGFKVQKEMCKTCIYKSTSPLDIEQLENQVRDKYGGFKEHRICHHSNNVCCAEFWKLHKDEFQMGQVAQRLGVVNFVQEDTLMSGDKNE